MSEQRLIDANALYKIMDKAIDDAPLYIQATVQQMIDCAPTIEAVPVVRGMWEWLQYEISNGFGNWHCSECRYIPPCKEEYQRTNFCPKCGARMDGDS